MSDYNEYIEKFGARDFMEIDVATKRTWEDESIVFDKLKDINTEESQITKATEPSWMPIFNNAAGMVMEVGGPLQHGGIIAREYGIPCVSALIGAMEIMNDGDLLEVDGSNGIVKIIESQKPKGNRRQEKDN